MIRHDNIWYVWVFVTVCVTCFHHGCVWHCLSLVADMAWYDMARYVLICSDRFHFLEIPLESLQGVPVHDLYWQLSGNSSSVWSIARHGSWTSAFRAAETSGQDDIAMGGHSLLCHLWELRYKQILVTNCQCDRPLKTYEMGCPWARVFIVQWWCAFNWRKHFIVRWRMVINGWH